MDLLYCLVYDLQQSKMAKVPFFLLMEFLVAFRCLPHFLWLPGNLNLPANFQCWWTVKHDSLRFSCYNNWHQSNPTNNATWTNTDWDIRCQLNINLTQSICTSLRENLHSTSDMNRSTYIWDQFQSSNFRQHNWLVVSNLCSSLFG